MAPQQGRPRPPPAAYPQGLMRQTDPDVAAHEPHELGKGPSMQREGPCPFEKVDLRDEAESAEVGEAKLEADALLRVETVLVAPPRTSSFGHVKIWKLAHETLLSGLESHLQGPWQQRSAPDSTRPKTFTGPNL